MPPRTTTWPLELHTRGKHMVLEHYMGAWLPIMTRWNGRVLFIDAFAGPGEYSRRRARIARDCPTSVNRSSRQEPNAK